MCLGMDKRIKQLQSFFGGTGFDHSIRPQSPGITLKLIPSSWSTWGCGGWYHSWPWSQRPTSCPAPPRGYGVGVCVNAGLTPKKSRWLIGNLMINHGILGIKTCSFRNFDGTTYASFMDFGDTRCVRPRECHLGKNQRILWNIGFLKYPYVPCVWAKRFLGDPIHLIGIGKSERKQQNLIIYTYI